MSKISFEGDRFSRKVTRTLLLLQIVAMVIVVGLSLADLFFPALAISLLMFILFVGIIFWLYSRYRELPIVREKRELERLILKFEKGIQSEGHIIRTASSERNRLFQSEKDEINTALRALQENHIENGLANASLENAVIPGLGLKLKERLAEHGILNAAEVTEKSSELPGFGEAKRQALMDWRGSVLTELEATKPTSLPDEPRESIGQKYRALHDQNNAAERKARTSKQMLEYELGSFRPRLRQLASITFVSYLSNSLASHGMVAAPMAGLLIITQVISSVSATSSAIIASIPTPTASSTVTMVPSQTFTPTVTFTTTATTIPSQTLTQTMTSTATATVVPSQTPTHTTAVIALPTFTPQVTIPTQALYVPPVTGGDVTGNCDPSYPGVCIPPPPPDLDCGDISYRRFQVLPPDPHNFDRDGDGIGCES